MLVARVESPSSVAVTMKSVDWPPSTMEPGLTGRASLGPCCRRPWLPSSRLLLRMRSLPRYMNCWTGSGRQGDRQTSATRRRCRIRSRSLSVSGADQLVAEEKSATAHASCSIQPRRAIVRSVKFRWAGPVRSKLPSSQTNRCVVRAAEDDAIEMDLATRPYLRRQEDRSINSA